jgi:tetratricopeptide (TPR) repeat protein
MISNTDISKLLNLEQDYNTDIASWEIFCTKFPYFSIAQLSKYAIQDDNTTIQTAHLHKGHPFLTTLFLQKLKDKNIILETTATISSDNIGEPLYTQDYFAHQNIAPEAPQALETFIEAQKDKKKVIQLDENAPVADDSQIMVTRSFADWLEYFRTKKASEQKETKEKEALRAMWQKEKLAAATGEENEIVPEKVFNMAISSINLNEDTVSESLAKILAMQGNVEKALEMYKKLSLKFPEKSTYFASKIKELQNN